jgi:hypothetical protein
LLLGKLLVERGDLGAGGELGCGVTGVEAAVEELIADGVGFMFGVGGVGGGFAGFGVMENVEEGNGDLYANGGVVLLEVEVVGLVVIVGCKAAVLSR